MNKIYDAINCMLVDAEKYIIPSNVKNKANAIAAKYCRGYIEPKLLQQMYNELNAIGVSVGLIQEDASHGPKKAEVYFKGKEVDNSLFIYSVYKGAENSTKNEYTIYFS